MMLPQSRNHWKPAEDQIRFEDLDNDEVWFTRVGVVTLVHIVENGKHTARGVALHPDDIAKLAEWMA